MRRLSHELPGQIATLEQCEFWPAGDDRIDDAPCIRVSARARRVSARVYQDGRVEVVVPRGVTARTVERFLMAHRDWIHARRTQALRTAAPREPFPPAQVEFALSGETWRIERGAGRRRARIAEHAGRLVLHGGAGERVERMLLRRWLLRAATRVLKAALVSVAADLAVEFRGLTVRRQRTRWGSCSALGNISLNACLVFQPRDVTRYLMIHELTHLTHMNHSAQFWAAVERHEPRWRELDRSLLNGWRHVPHWVFRDE